MQVPQELWPKARKLAQLYNEVNTTKTQELYNAANDAANAFDMEMQSFEIKDRKAFPEAVPGEMTSTWKSCTGYKLSCN